MNKQDFAIFLGLAEIANQNGLIALDAFQSVGISVAKAKAAVEAMQEGDVMVIQKRRQETTDPEPSESAWPNDSTPPEQYKAVVE